MVQKNLPKLKTYYMFNVSNLMDELDRFENLIEEFKLEESSLLTENKVLGDAAIMTIKNNREEIKILKFFTMVRKSIGLLANKSADDLVKNLPIDLKSEKKLIKNTESKHFFMGNEVSAKIIVNFILEYSSNNFITILNYARILLSQESLGFSEKDGQISLTLFGCLLLSKILQLVEIDFGDYDRFSYLKVLTDWPWKSFFAELIKSYLLQDLINLDEFIPYKEHRLKPSIIKDKQTFFEELDFFGDLVQGGELFRLLSSSIEEQPQQLFIRSLLSSDKLDAKLEISNVHLNLFRKIELQRLLVKRWSDFVIKEFRQVRSDENDLLGALIFAIKNAPNIESKQFKCYVSYIKYLCFLSSLNIKVFSFKPNQYQDEDQDHVHPLRATYRAHLQLEKRAFKVTMLETFFSFPEIKNKYKKSCYDPYISLEIKPEDVSEINNWRQQFFASKLPSKNSQNLDQLPETLRLT